MYTSLCSPKQRLHEISSESSFILNYLDADFVEYKSLPDNLQALYNVRRLVVWTCLRRSFVCYKVQLPPKFLHYKSIKTAFWNFTVLSYSKEKHSLWRWIIDWREERCNHISYHCGSSWGETSVSFLFYPVYGLFSSRKINCKLN